jgi:type IV secretory pathway TrbF-like protein
VAGSDDHPPAGDGYPEDELGSRRTRRKAAEAVRAAETFDPSDPYPARRATEDERPTPRRRRRSLFAVLTSVVLALALVGAGVWWFALRQAGVRPADYARSICGNVRDWQQAIDSSNSALVTSIARQEDRSKVRTAVTTYYTAVAGRTDQLRTTILDAGVADTAGGQEYANSLAAAVGNEATALRDLATRAGRLDPDPAATFQIQLQSLLTGSETAVGNVSAALARPSTGTPTQIRTALSAEPSCAPYVG